MRFIKTINKYINESYKRLDDYEFSDEYEEKFAEYTLNERPFFLNSKQMEECKELYGNRNVGIVYHGGKINDFDTLKMLETMNSGDTINMKFKSATPVYDTAESFAKYVKSYDELTMLHSLNNTYIKGSSGEYGCYIVKLKPKPEQVIIANFGEGNIPRYSSETECILYGDIEVLDVEIIKPLSKESINEYLINLDVLKMFDSFTVDWLRYHKIKIDKKIFLDKYKAIKDVNKFNKFIIKYSNDHSSFIFNDITFNEAIQNPLFKELLSSAKFNKDTVTISLKINNDKINISAFKGLHTYLVDVYKNDIIKFINSVKIDDKYEIEIYNDDKYSSIGYIYISDNQYQFGVKGDVLNSIIWVNDKNIIKNNPLVSKLNNVIDDFLDENIINKKVDDLSNIQVQGICNFIFYLYQLSEYASNILISKKIKIAMMHIYDNFFRGKIENKNSVNKLTRILPNVLDILTNMSSRNINEGYNDFLLRKGYYNDNPFPFKINAKLIKETDKAYLFDTLFNDENGNNIRKNIWVTKTQAHISSDNVITLSKWMISRINESNSPLKINIEL